MSFVSMQIDNLLPATAERLELPTQMAPLWKKKSLKQNPLYVNKSHKCEKAIFTLTVPTTAPR